MVCEEHDIAMRRSRIHDICPTSHIVSGEVKLKEPMVVYAVILNEHEIMRIPFQAYGRSSIGGCADCGGFRK
jgi:hypothetical protein